MNMNSLKYLAAGAVLMAGCVSGDLSSSRRIHPDDETMDGGISSADIRTVASKMCPAILSVPEVADGQPPVRIKIANVKNGSRFFIDGDLFAKRLRIELNRYGGGQVRFLDKNEKTQVARTSVLKDRQVEDLRRDIRELGREIGANALFQNSARPVKIAVIPVLNANLVNMNADSFTAMLRSEIRDASGGKVQFLLPGHTEGADYWLTGQFYPESLKKEGIINLAEYIEVVDARVKAGKSLYLDPPTTTTVSPDQTMVTTSTTTRESVLVDMLHSPAMHANPNVNKRLNVMIVKPDDKVCVYEKTALLDRRISDNSGKAALILSCEISGMSQALNGVHSDYLVIAMQLVEPESNEVVWEDAYEVKRLSRAGIAYR
jgi:PBP1b-binding outer membrane lipoprotein LpoB